MPDPLSLINRMKEILIGILVILTIGIISIDKSKHKRSFNSEKWINPDTGEQNWQTRWEMIGSLKWHHKLKGKSSDEIIELLGEPTTKNAKSWSYDLGPSGNGINYGSLRIKFYENKVSEFNIIEH